MGYPNKGLLENGCLIKGVFENIPFAKGWLAKAPVENETRKKGYLEKYCLVKASKPNSWLWRPYFKMDFFQKYFHAKGYLGRRSSKQGWTENVCLEKRFLEIRLP